METTRLTAMRTQRGFTLTELVVTLTVAAILAAVAAPSMSTMLVGNRIRTSGTDLMSALLLARSEAIKRNGQVAVQPTSGNWSQGWIVAAVATGEQYDKKNGIGTDVQVSGPSVGVVYDRNGRLAALGTASIELADVHHRVTPRCLAIDLSGMPKITYGSCT
jgi:type IV fimbrial biogenesis protein FimT